MLAIVVSAGAAFPAGAQTFDGITIIELDDFTGSQSIGGGNASHIVVFVSATGTYAALTNRGGRQCFAWAQDGSYNGGSITFGVPRDEQTGGRYPPICLPFTLSLEGPNRVRVAAGPNYSRARKVVAHVPLVAFDWSRPNFARHDIEGVTLGPVPVMEAKFAGTARIRINPRQLVSGATHEKSMRVAIPNPNDEASPRNVTGRIIAAESIGWPWDVIVRAEKTERLPEKSLIDVFDQAVFDRYGPGSLREVDKARTGVTFSWFYDVFGQPVDISNASNPDSCFATRALWEFSKEESDLGPWGCGLVFTVTHDGIRDFVRVFSIAAVSGYPMALSHFARRLNELKATRERNDAIRSAPVDF